MKKYIGLILIVIILSTTGSSFSESFYTDVNSSHWAYSAITELGEMGIIDQSQQFGLGRNIDKSDLSAWLSNLNLLLPDAGLKPIDYELESIENVNRLSALKQIITAMGFSAQAERLKVESNPFTDVLADSGYIVMALDYGLITLNEARLFRPMDSMTREEAAVVVYRLLSQYAKKMPHLMSYYAISSYGQASFSESLTDLTYGWSRFELDENQSIVLNTTSSNNNEYSFPQGHEIAFEATLSEDISTYLMTFVKDENVYDPIQNKQVKLVEYLIGTPESRLKTVQQIKNTLEKHQEFKGVLIDFETLKGETNAEYLNAFLSLLDATLGNNYKIATAIHPPRDTTDVYFDGYDFKHIGNVSDLVILMAHDYNAKRLSEQEMASGLTLTPLTPINEVYYAIKKVLDGDSGMTDSNKLILQLSMDSAQWKVSNGSIINSKPYNPTYTSILNRIDAGAIQEYSERYHNPSLIFKDELDESRNIVWYEDTRSIQAKINLAKLFNLGGISVWRLGTIPAFKGTTLDIWGQILMNY